jgi:peptidoglycan/xylan/chitin deacetylase (PgdA/CDA1 family)
MPRRGRWRDAAIWTTARVAAGLGPLCGHRSDGAFGILCYHRVADRVSGVERPTWSVTPRQLRSQLAGLLARGYEAWPLSRLLEARRASETIPTRAFAVTFDDGYENNYLHALPILKELKIPATIFIVTKFLDTDRPFPFDDWGAAGSREVPASTWRPLSTCQCRKLLASGIISLGAHTHSHELFVGRVEAFRRDLDACLDVLRERFGVTHPAFAFPWGVSSPDLIDALKQVGIPCSMSTRRAPVGVNDDDFHWGRFDVEAGDTAAVLAGKLSGWYTAVAAAAKVLARPLSVVATSPRRRGAGRGKHSARCDESRIESLSTLRVGP